MTAPANSCHTVIIIRAWSVLPSWHAQRMRVDTRTRFSAAGGRTPRRPKLSASLLSLNGSNGAGVVQTCSEAQHQAENGQRICVEDRHERVAHPKGAGEATTHVTSRCQISACANHAGFCSGELTRFGGRKLPVVVASSAQTKRARGVSVCPSRESERARGREGERARGQEGEKAGGQAFE
eukprot:6206899-Pleurochrysis_carterae.AAC.1